MQIVIILSMIRQLHSMLKRNKKKEVLSVIILERTYVKVRHTMTSI